MLGSESASGTLLAKGKHDKEGRQRALLSSATVTFAERGYDAATTREIADRANCSEGLIHRYFGGKPGLLAAVLQERGDIRREDLVAQLPRAENVADELSRLMSWEADRCWEDRASMRVSVSRSIVDPELGKSAGEQFHTVRAAFLEERLEWHRDQGRIRKDVNLNAIAALFSGLAFNAAFFAQVAYGEDRDHIKEGGKVLSEVIARGLAP